MVTKIQPNKMSQQQQQSNPVKPMKINPKMDSSIRNAKGQPTGKNSSGAGWGGEKPVMKSTMKKAVKKLPSKMKVMKSISKSMGY